MYLFANTTLSIRHLIESHTGAGWFNRAKYLLRAFYNDDQHQLRQLAESYTDPDDSSASATMAKCVVKPGQKGKGKVKCNGGGHGGGNAKGWGHGGGGGNGGGKGGGKWDKRSRGTPY